MTPSETMNSYQDFHRKLLQDLYQAVVRQVMVNQESLSKDDEQFVSLLRELSENPNATKDGQHLGQQLIGVIVARYPQITPMVPRDLFWFFGGDCLHYLGDEEIAFFQQLDEEYHNLLAQEPDKADYRAVRASRSGEQPLQIN